MTLRIALATDHGGFAAKNELAEALSKEGYHIMDCGTYKSDSTDYPIYAARLGAAVSQGKVDYGILLCRSGIGMSMVANRYQGVRAALVNSEITAELSRTHNNANVLVMGSDHMNASFLKLAQIFLTSDFEGGRHARRVGQIDVLDQIIDAHSDNGHSRYHGQSVWTQKLITESQVKDFKATNLRGYSVTFDHLIQLLESKTSAIQDRFEKLEARNATVDEKIDALIEHELVKTTEALHPIAVFTREEDGVTVIPVALDEKATAEDYLTRISQYRDRWADFSISFRLPGTETGIEVAFELLAQKQNAVLYGIDSKEKVETIFDEFSQTVPELNDTQTYLMIQIPDSLMGTEEIKSLLEEKTSFNAMADAYRRGIPTPIIIREGTSLNKDYLSGSKFVLTEKQTTINDEMNALEKLKSNLS